MTTLNSTLPLLLAPSDSLRAPAAAGGFDRLLPARHREKRIVCLLWVIAALSGLDLLLTLHHMTGMGMFEANVLARWLIERTESRLAIANFKALSILTSGAVLYRLRRHRSAEIGAWIGAGVLTALMVKWAMYVQFIASLDSETIAGLSEMAGWVQF